MSDPATTSTAAPATRGGSEKAAHGVAGLLDVEIYSVDRRQGQRRRHMLKVLADRRSGHERRNKYRNPNLKFLKPRIKTLFDGFLADHRYEHPILLVSDGHKLSAVNGGVLLLEAITGFSHQEFDSLEKAYTNPKERRRIFKEIKRVGCSRNKIQIHTAYGVHIILDALFLRERTLDTWIYKTFFYIIDIVPCPLCKE